MNWNYKAFNKFHSRFVLQFAHSNQITTLILHQKWTLIILHLLPNLSTEQTKIRNHRTKLLMNKNPNTTSKEFDPIVTHCCTNGINRCKSHHDLVGENEKGSWFSAMHFIHSAIYYLQGRRNPIDQEPKSLRTYEQHAQSAWVCQNLGKKNQEAKYF